jgi:predicted acetyltransferase
MVQRGAPNEVTLDSATEADAALLSNLLEFYLHDLSAAFPIIELDTEGHFRYTKLPLYWSEPSTRFAFLIRCDGRVAGFALATVGSPASSERDVLDVAEFFVLRSYRRRGVGQRAAALLWRRLPGTWFVRASEGNSGAVPFWRETITQFSNGSATETTRHGEPHAWRVFSFDSSG